MLTLGGLLVFHKALKSLLSKGDDGNKSPRPDGYTMEFFKKHWNILRLDIMRVFQDFFEKAINTNLNKP